MKNAVKTIAATLAVFMAIWASGLWLGHSVKSALSPTRAAITPPNQNYVAVVFVSGPIQNTASDPMSAYPQSYNHNATIAYINSLIADENNTGIFLELNTPGGGVYETDALYLALMKYKEETGRPIYAFIHSYSYSGGYYISMAADRIGANRNSMTGSIGVIMSHVSYAGLYEMLGINISYITSGTNKAMGADGNTLSEEQLAIYQGIVDESYDQFVDIICVGRGMDEEFVRTIGDGRIYTSNQALELGMIDEITEHDTMFIAFCTELESIYYAPDLREYSFLQQILNIAETTTPKTEAEAILEIIESFQPGVPLYIYAGA